MKFRSLICLCALGTMAISGCQDSTSDITINNAPPLKISPAYLTVHEVGAGGEILVEFFELPTAPVTIRATVGDPGEIALSFSEQTLTPDNWAWYLVFDVTGIDDGQRDGDQMTTVTFTIQSDDPKYGGLDPVVVAVTCMDNGSSPATGYVFEYLTELVTSEDGSFVEFTIALDSAPTADVVLTIVSSDETKGIVQTPTLIFTPTNYAFAQTVRIVGIDDDEADGDVMYTISFSAASADSRYHANNPADIVLVNRDDDVAGVAGYVFEYLTDLVTTEDDSRAVEFTIALSAKPTADVFLTLASSDETEGIAEPWTLIFTPTNYASAQTVKIIGVDDDEVDGDVTYSISFSAASTDPRYHANNPADIVLVNRDDDEPSIGTTYRIRMMAANTSSGNYQSYEMPGIRMFQAMVPDIVMIQEFNYRSGSTRDLVDTAFGKEFYYYRGTGNIPNGIVSRYEIVQSGAWPSSAYSDRNWDWAIVDIPGPRDLLVVSVHLHTDKNASEMPGLMAKIRTKQAEGNYYVVLGGDLNTSARNAPISNFGSMFHVAAPWPVDQKGNDGTNAARGKPYDWILFSKDLESFEVPVVIGKHAYPDGHVFDSRVYSSLGELSDVSPVQSNDSGASQMQHMPVIRDIQYVY